MTATLTDYRIEPLDLRRASDAEHAALSDFENQARAERQPDDPPIPIEERAARWRNLPEHEVVSVFVAREPGRDEIVGRGEVGFERAEENQHLVWFEVFVLPEHRGRGLGTRLLEPVAGAAQAEGRRLMLTETSGRVPAGDAFMERLGAERGLTSHTNQLLVADLDRSLLREWIERAPQRAVGYRVGFWDGSYPEDELEAICRLIEVMNTEPRSAEIEDWKVTPERIREWERVQAAAGDRKVTAYARETATGRLVGFTQVAWNENRPETLNQYGTGVFPEARNLGLGRWLKAAMLERMLGERPGIVRVRTGNADVNAPMLGINHALGFKPYLSWTNWQVDTQRVLEHLAGR